MGRGSRRSRYESYSEWPEYVTVAERRTRAARAVSRLGKKGSDLDPVRIDGRAIATTPWGRAWCAHIEAYRDYVNRLPRGRSYVRNGSVIHLAIAAGKIEARVAGSEIYEVTISIPALAAARWKSVVEQCAGRIDSVVQLLAGKLDAAVMARLCDATDGLFPGPRQLGMSCSCPDYATMCKHVAAVLYGVGNRLDRRPELLFTLRGVSHEELVVRAAVDSISRKPRPEAAPLAGTDLGALFGIDLDDGTSAPRSGAPRAPAKAKAATVRKSERAAGTTVTRKPK